MAIKSGRQARNQTALESQILLEKTWDTTGRVEAGEAYQIPLLDQAGPPSLSTCIADKAVVAARYEVDEIVRNRSCRE